MTTYIAAGPLVNYFFYKAIGVLDPPPPNIPLDFGKIYFYADEDHSMPLNSFSDVSDPNNPVVNPWPLRLGGQGDVGVIYLEDRLYFIQIFSKDDILQWTINHFNPGGGSGGSSNDALNYIPNGQFLLHNDLPATDTLQAGEIRAASTDIAPGGWTFERPDTSTATDIVTFFRYDEYITSPVSNPRYALRVQCTDFDSEDGFKLVRVKFPNVNRFASTTQQYTVGFSAIDNIDNAATVELYLTKNFGTDGDAETSTLIETFNITPNWQSFSVAFVYGANTGKVIGTNDDDFVALDFRLRTDEELDLNLVDFLQESGNIINPVYPETPQRFDVKEALGGGFPVPAYDGSDFLLPPILTADGWIYDHGLVGSVIAQTVPCLPLSGTYPSIIGYIYADGSQYETAAYFPGNVPCARLQSKYLNRDFTDASDDEFIPRYGTGRQFVTTNFVNNAGLPAGGSQNLRIVNNSVGSVTDFTNGTPSTGFTITNVSSGSVNTNSWGLYFGSTPTATTFYIWGKAVGALMANIAVGTSGFTVSQLRNSSLVKGLASVSTVVPSAGQYFTFSNTATNYYVWYKVNAAGSDPAPGGTGIEVDILSTWNAAEVAKATAAAISGFKQTAIITTAGSTVPAGSYFNLNTATQEYYVWYEKDGAGTDPAPGGKKPIKVLIGAAYTADEVGGSTLVAINQKYFAVPDLRGMILRGWDNGAGIDTDTALRWSFYNNLTLGNNVGSIQLDEILQHLHTYQFRPNNADAGDGPTQTASSDTSTELSSFTGGSESRPINTYVNYLIKY